MANMNEGESMMCSQKLVGSTSFLEGRPTPYIHLHSVLYY